MGDSRTPGASRVSRRTILKGLGAAVGASATPGLLGRRAHAGAGRAADPSPGGSPRAFVYVDHALGTQWVAGALLSWSSRLPRQVLRRARRARLSPQALALPELEARNAPESLRRLFYRLLAERARPGRGRDTLVEVCGIHAAAGPLAGLGGQRGLAEVHLVITLLNACRLFRFGEVFVYHNLPAFAGVSRRQFRDAILLGVRRHPGARFEIHAQRAVLDTGPVTLVNEAVQAADFVTHAFFQKHVQGNPEGLDLLRRIVRRDIEGDRDPELQAILQA